MDDLRIKHSAKFSSVSKLFSMTRLNWLQLRESFGDGEDFRE